MTDEYLLIVEDEKKIAELLKDYLVAAGFLVGIVDRGDTAVAEVRNNPPALVLLDIMLPGMDGMEVCRAIRKFSSVPIIMITARVEEINRIMGLELGADDYVCKPFNPCEVVARVRAVLRRSRPQSKETRFKAGPIDMDCVKHEVTVGGERVSLTPNEFAILKALIARPNKVFTRAELLNLVQGQNVEGYERTIDSHVKNLRKKVADRFPSHEVISTVYGIGYKINTDTGSSE